MTHSQHSERRDRLHAPTDGPDAMWSTELPPSRGQYESIAVLACQLLGVPLDHRFDATTAITRLRLSLGSDAAPSARPTVDPITEF